MYWTACMHACMHACMPHMGSRPSPLIDAWVCFSLRTCLSPWHTLAIPSHEHPTDGMWEYCIHTLAWDASVLHANPWVCICLSEYRNMLKTCNASLSPSLSIAISGVSWNSMKRYETCESALPQLWYKGRGRCTNSSNEAHQYQMHQQKVARRQNIVIYSSWGLSQKLLWLTNGFYMFLLSNPINMPSHNILRLCGASLAFQGDEHMAAAELPAPRRA